MKIIAFGASSSKNSINKQLATYTASLFENAQVEILDLNNFELPLFSIDLETEIGQHPQAKAFLDKLALADLIVVSLAEHNGNYATAFKNILDWCSRINGKIFQEKKVLLMATSPGARGGMSVLELAKGNFPRFAANIQATFSLPSFNDNFNAEKGIITNPDLDQELKKIVLNLR